MDDENTYHNQMPQTAGQAYLNIDRITPTLRPTGRRVMRQQWRDLLFLHWEVSPAQLQTLLPSELTLDIFDGKAYVGLVPFTMRNVRPIWSPSVPPLSNFHETNVRTYVHYKGHDPGVWFFSLDAANPIAVQIARLWFKLPYYYARMRLEKTASSIHYVTERLWPAPVPAACHVDWTTEAGIRHAEPNTLEYFLIERYILYAYRNGCLYSGQVHHPAYPVQNAAVGPLGENLIAQAGITRPDTLPPLVHYSAGVDVDIFPLRRVKE